LKSCEDAVLDNRTDQLAQLLANYCVEVREGDWVLVRADLAALPLVECVVQQVLHAGGHPTVQLSADSLDETVLRHASDEQLSWLSPVDQLLAERVDARIMIRAAGNTRALSGIAPERQRVQQNAYRSISQTYMQRAADGSHRWALTVYPCDAYAQEADMSLREYADFVYAATYADQPDPVACWRSVHDRQQRLVDWLAGKSQVVARGPNVDLSLSIAGRTFVNSDGKRNMPSGEIFTGPVEESVEGWIRFSYPALRGGREVDNVEFVFEQGKVVRASAGKNEAYLLSQLDSDPGARYLGEFAVGTNDQIQRFTKNILFDEKIGGTLHVAVGAGYPETGSRNRSSVHWDFICDMRQDSEIWVDGQLFYKNGKFSEQIFG
jgi:aminopeptidase